MREVATHALALLEGFDYRAGFTRAPADVGNVLEDPIAHRRCDRVRRLQMPEKILRLLPEPVRPAVAAREQERDGLGIAKRKVAGS